MRLADVVKLALCDVARARAGLPVKLCSCGERARPQKYRCAYGDCVRVVCTRCGGLIQFGGYKCYYPRTPKY